MARPLAQLAALQRKHHGCPILYAGDIFDRWNAAPEVINFALQHLPRGYAVPGQHDLPNHSYDEIRRSAYWTLVEAGKLVNLPPGEPFVDPLWFDGLVLYGYPWGYQPTQPAPTELQDKNLLVAVIHRFIYTKDTGYPGAPSEALVSASRGGVPGYDVAVYGDNHKGFIIHPNGWGGRIINCGGLMRRKTDERNYQPSVGLLYSDGGVKRHGLDVSEDSFIELTAAEEAIEKLLDMAAFVDGLRGLGANDALDFVAAVKRFLDSNSLTDRVRDIILTAVEGSAAN